jgi:hypothetical protein
MFGTLTQDKRGAARVKREWMLRKMINLEATDWFWNHVEQFRNKTRHIRTFNPG